MRLLVSFAFFCACAAFASTESALQWDSSRIERRALSNAPVVKVDYHFQNTSSAPVTILDIKSSCGCTVGELTKRTYAPGELGTLEVAFNPKNRLGTNHVGIDVKTDVSDQPIRLGLTVEVVEQMRSPRRLLLWKRQAEPIEPKRLDIYFEDVGEILELTAFSASDMFDAEMAKTPDPFHWKLRVTPKDAVLPSSGSVQSRITLVAKTKDAGELKLVIFARINP